MPMCSRPASAVSATVRPPTITTSRTSVPRPKCLRAVSSRWPSCAMAVEGASTPVAKAIATGNASSTANVAECAPGFGVAGACPMECGAAKPITSAASATRTNKAVIRAKRSRSPCPNHVSPATITGRSRAKTMRHGGPRQATPQPEVLLTSTPNHRYRPHDRVHLDLCWFRCASLDSWPSRECLVVEGVGERDADVVTGRVSSDPQAPTMFVSARRYGLKR